MSLADRARAAYLATHGKDQVAQVAALHAALTATNIPYAPSPYQGRDPIPLAPDYYLLDGWVTAYVEDVSFVLHDDHLCALLFDREGYLRPVPVTDLVSLGEALVNYPGDGVPLATGAVKLPPPEPSHAPGD